MNPSNRTFILLSLCGLGLAFRFWQADRGFQAAQAVFPEPRAGVFRAWVSEEPELFFTRESGNRDTGRKGGAYQPGVREVRAVCVLLSLDGAALPPIQTRFTLRLSGGHPLPVLSYGDEITVAGKILKPPSAMNPGQFDYARYLKNKEIAYVFYAAPGKWGKVSENKNTEHGWAFVRWSYELKRWNQETLYRYLPFPENALLDGILFGEKAAIPGEMTESFFLTGTLHILAVSGLMTTFVAGLLFLALRYLWFPRKASALATLVGLAAFILMTGACPPVCRSGLFSALALWAVLCERKIHGGFLLVSTAWLLAVYNPFTLLDLSFQISFLATAGLMVMSGRIMDKISFLGKHLAGLAASSFSAQLAVSCILLYAFNQFSPYSFPANLLVVPLALFATASGLAFLAGAWIHPALGEALAAVCGVSLKLLALLTGWMSGWPGAQMTVATPPPAWTLLFHGILLASFYFFWPSRIPEKPSPRWKRKREMTLTGRKIILRVWALFLLGSGSVWLVSGLAAKPLRAVFLSVGHGNAVVLESPSGSVLVVDGGMETKGSDRFNKVVAYLRHRGINRVEGLLNTHPDSDHVGGLLNLASAYPVGRAWEGVGAKADTKVYGDYRKTLQREGIRTLKLSEGDPIEDLYPAGISVLHPSLDFHPRIREDNNRSVVSLLSYPRDLGPFKLLLPGDLEREGILKVLRDHPETAGVDWLMAPHHGRRSGEPVLCAEGFRPRFVVLSDARDYPLSREQYQEGSPGSVVLSTALEGAVELEVYPDGRERYRTFLGKKWREVRKPL